MAEEPVPISILSAQVQHGRGVKEASLPLMTLSVASQLLYFQRTLDLVADVPGDVVECGVGWGRSLLSWALLVQLEGKGREVWGFDSFEGFPDPSPHDHSPRGVKRGEWKTDRESVLKMLEASGLAPEFLRLSLRIVKGFFHESLPRYPRERIAVLHIDADLYQSYLDVLTQLYAKVVPGGVILFDEYLNPIEQEKFPGAQRAIDEFFQGREPILRDAIAGKYYAVKGS